MIRAGSKPITRSCGGLYPDEYVAVVDGKVVGHKADIENLLAQLRPTYGDATSELAIKFIYKETPAIVL